MKTLIIEVKIIKFLYIFILLYNILIIVFLLLKHYK